MNQREKLITVINEAKKTVFGQDDMLEAILCALACQGHLLIEGMPGLGKTLAVSIMSKLCNLDFKRVQFTPDLLPSDLIGTMVYNQSKEEFSTKFGPIFTQILLADEINRSPAKVQAALLESMAEKQVTIGDTSYKLKQPFVVLATQNPIEQEGTYNLPEAQLDRFMMKVNVGYPDFASEIGILDLEKVYDKKLNPILGEMDLMSIREEISSIYVDEKIKKLIVKMVHATRPDSAFYLKEFDGAITAGASPRASIWLYNISRFKAYLDGSDHVNPDHIMSVIPSVLGHRVVLSYEAIIDKISVEEVVTKIAGKCL